jgi:7-cyano-7-deazaguanine synthase in queuosine biosynthesis
MIDNAETLRSPNLGDWPIHYVLSEFTKAQIYEMYKTYDIQDLFDLTLSCDKYNGSECGTCFGCAERSYLENNI